MVYKKEDTAQLIGDTNAVGKLKKRSEAYEKSHGEAIAEIDDTIQFLTSKKGVQELVTDTIQRLEHERASRQIDFKKEERLSVWGFGQVEGNSFDLLVPLEYTDDVTYSGLQKILYDHCISNLRQLGRVSHSDFNGFLNIGIISKADPEKIGYALRSLTANPPEFEDANVAFGVHVTYFPLFRKRERSMSSTQATPVRTGTLKSKLLEYAAQHGEITVKDGVEYCGSTKATVYQALHALEKDGHLKKTGARDGKYAPTQISTRKTVEDTAAKSKTLKEKLLECARQHSGISVQEGVVYSGSSKVVVYQTLHALEKEGKLEKTGTRDGKYAFTEHDKPEGKTAGKRADSTGIVLGYFAEKGEGYTASIKELADLNVSRSSIYGLKNRGLIKSADEGQFQITIKGLKKMLH